ncbi:MAG: hypothetical protein ABSH31_00325 [Bryobacteraceae bacterium]
MTSVYRRLRLKKRTSINSNSDFHKEKEMVDFRKLLMAFAAAALLFGLGSVADAQSTSFICNATAGNPHIVRSEGVAELVGDLVLNCTGGVPTTAGNTIQPTNVQINLNTNVTSRLTGTAGSVDSEAILSIDEPFPGPNGTTGQTPFPTTATPVPGATTTQLGCLADGLSSCLTVTSLGAGFGAAGSYNGSPGHPNIFQGILNGGFSQVNWQGVPIDAPGTTVTRIIRITNVRANASQLAGGTTSSLIPITITELIGVSGSQTIIINNPLQTVALIERGLIGSINPPAGPVSYQQCNSLNLSLLDISAVGVSAGPIILSATEGFAASFKSVSYFGEIGTAYYAEQDVLGYSYFTESGWIPYDVSGLDQSGRVIGLADTGTEITFSLAGIQSGASLFVPNEVFLVGPTGIFTGGRAYLVTSLTSPYEYNPGSVSGTTQLTVTAGTAAATYVIFYPDPTIVESLNVPLSVAYQTTSATVPAANAPGTYATAAINFAPLSTVGTATAGPVPRFTQNYPAASAFAITPCTCNLLFPFVTNQAGFDTGIAIANTTTDPYNTVAQTGTITLNYYGNTPGTTAGVAPYTTQAAVPTGQELVFTLSNGGGVPGGSAPSIAVPATAGFQGYIIAQANFQYCHGFAFISDTGAQKLAEGYLAISLDAPYFPSYSVTLYGGDGFFTGTSTPNAPTGLNRTGNGGENGGH